MLQRCAPQIAPCMAFSSHQHVQQFLQKHQRGAYCCKGHLHRRGGAQSSRLPRRRYKANRVQMNSSDREYLSDSIRTIPDFPHAGIMFQDVTSMLLDPKAFRICIEDFVKRYKDMKIDVVAGFEARGFIFGAPLALALDCAFVPLRKPGKLPGETIGASYKLEYGEDRIEMHKGHVTAGQRVVLIDDLIATGGTLGAGITLMQQVNAEVVECACVLELPELKGVEKLGGLPLYVQVQKAGL